MPKIAGKPRTHNFRKEVDEMSSDSQSAVTELLTALVSGERIEDKLARDSGYDVHVFQKYMDLAAPSLDHLRGYKPLFVWLRNHDDEIQITSQQDVSQYNKVLRINRNFVQLDKYIKDYHDMQTVEVYVTRDGKYLVTILEVPNRLKRHQYTKERMVRIIECATAEEIALVLNPMRLQWERHQNFNECYRVVSPTLKVAQGLRHLLGSYRAVLHKELTALDESLDGMKAPANA
jgi:hypothetical protein